MKALVAVIASLFLFFPTNAQDKEREQILQVMEVQKTAWNKGDIAAFMETYWKNDSLLFVGSKGPTYGWENTMNNYIKSYPNKESMGTLAFDILDVRPLSSSYYFVLGRWHLQRQKGDIGGAFTLLFRKIANHWVIVADHSS
ncbi:YybH family protein [Olivibacter sitiensis]|uniref:YybH family protein n=1 Tax=Olivibacter sitiensis TaxID=376470 RepID=UPI000482F653|nr:nuclear transport factor 2 family protein [Olivibacter sitiensis]